MPKSIIFLLLVAFVSLSSASLLRGLAQNNAILQEAPQSSTDSFDCYPYEIDGLGEIGVKISPKWNCKSESSDTEASQTLTFQGDIKSIMRTNFDADITIPGATKMTIPWDAISTDDSTIMSSHAGITISQDHNRRERHLAPKSPFHRVLIVRAVTRGSSIALANQLKNDFYQDENNLKKRLEACSAGKLKIYPAKIKGSDKLAGNHGIITMNLDIKAADHTYDQIGDLISERLIKQHNDLEYTTRIYIIADSAKWGYGAAWAEVGGNTIWVQNSYSHTPMVQVHEYGHLLGMRHSGDDATYDDDTCYMGGVLDWSDKGNNMCFNASKTWYLGWYNQYNIEIDVETEAFRGSLIGIDDASKGNAGDSKVVVKVNTFFIMYNRKKGINSGTKAANGDKVVITSQTGSNEVSNKEGVLGPGNEWTYSNFSSSQQTLVVKFCHKVGEEASVLIFIRGVNDQQCNNPFPGNNNNNNEIGSTTCQNKNEWKDSDGDTCAFYEEDANRCGLYGDLKGTDGLDARDACCICKGNDNENSGNPENCTVDEQTWHDAGDPRFNCDWYAEMGTQHRCEKWGDKFENYGCTANQRCSACQS